MPHLNHATVFDTPERRREMLEVLERFGTQREEAVASVYSAGIWSGFWMYTKSIYHRLYDN
jgi:ABC-type sulfate transport system permease subunit